MRVVILVHISQAFALAGQLMPVVSALDPTVPVESEILLESFAEAIVDTNFTHDELKRAAMRVYTTSEDLPRNKIGAILAEARKVRKDDRRQRREAWEARQERALPAASRFGDPDPGVYEFRHAAPGQYSVSPLELPCGVCGADSGEQCVDGGRALKRPHFSRIFRAAAV